MDILTIAVVGVGYRAQEQLRTIAALTDRYRLVGVADADQQRRDSVAGEYGVPGFAGAEEMVTAVNPDVVMIAVPPDGHHPIAVLAAERGIHIITEVPVAPTLAMADVMIDAAREHNVHLAVTENVWRWPTEQLKRRVIDRGLLGDLTQVHLWYGSGSYHGMSAVCEAVGVPTRRALGVADTVATRPRVDLMGRTTMAEPWELGVIEFANDVTCVYQQPVHHERSNHWEFVGTEGYLSGSTLVLEEDRRRIEVEREVETIDGLERLVRLRMDLGDVEVEWENPLRGYAIGEDDGIARGLVLTELHDAVLGGGAVTYDGAKGRRDQEILLALRESAHIGSTWVDLPLTGATTFEQEFHQSYRERYGVDPFDRRPDMASSAYPRMGVSQYVGPRVRG